MGNWTRRKTNQLDKAVIVLHVICLSNPNEQREKTYLGSFRDKPANMPPIIVIWKIQDDQANNPFLYSLP